MELPTSYLNLTQMVLWGTQGHRYTFDFDHFYLSSPWEVFGVIMSYLMIIYGLQYVMKSRQKLELGWIAFGHNLFLAVSSFGLLVLIATEIIPILWHHGLFFAICNSAIFNGRLEFLFYINYMFKVYELLDTVLLVLKKRPLTFLHVYHHCLTFILVYTQFAGQSAVQWVPIMLNLWVHTLMYWYYAMISIRRDVWWKRYLTSLQIIQFVLDIFACYYAAGILVGHVYLNYEATCHGSSLSAIFGCALLTSYLVLFVDFYRITYKHKELPVTSPTLSKNKHKKRSKKD